MGFYDLSKEERIKVTQEIELLIYNDIEKDCFHSIARYSSDEDTYIRKIVYIAIGRLYRTREDLRKRILSLLAQLIKDSNEKIRQTVVYSLGEIGKVNFDDISELLAGTLSDEHHSVRNGVIGAIKQLSEKNPIPTLAFAKRFLHHEDPKIRREIVHGIELRGRTNPEDIMPILEELQHDKDPMIIDMIVHVIGQISYKKGCLEKVIGELNKWTNEGLIQQAIPEILDVHKRYAKFSSKTIEEAEEYINIHFRSELGWT